MTILMYKNKSKREFHRVRDFMLFDKHVTIVFEDFSETEIAKEEFDFVGVHYE